MNYQSYAQVTIACNTVESPILHRISVVIVEKRIATLLDKKNGRIMVEKEITAWSKNVSQTKSEKSIRRSQLLYHFEN